MRCLQLQSIRISQRVNKLYGVVTRSEGWPDFRACSELGVQGFSRCLGRMRRGRGRKDNRLIYAIQYYAYAALCCVERTPHAALRCLRYAALRTPVRYVRSWRAPITKLTHVYNFATVLTKYISFALHVCKWVMIASTFLGQVWLDVASVIVMVTMKTNEHVQWNHQLLFDRA